MKIEINSFSYKKTIPSDKYGNGGGFVFDMRGILNPGRQDQYKKLSGLDNTVKQFLRSETDIDLYLENAFKLLSLTIDNYLSRGFENLQINYGCTGGQHRSVYSAEKTANWIKNTYPEIQITLTHTNKDNWLV